MAPELFQKSKTESGIKFTRECDIYSFGMVVWELICCVTPWKDENIGLIPFFVSKGRRPEIPDACPIVLKWIVEKCWSQEASGRPVRSITIEKKKNSHLRITDFLKCLFFLFFRVCIL